VKANLQKRIDEVANDLAKGKSREQIVSKFSKKFQTTPRTIDNYIGKAKELANELRKQANEAAANDSKVQETESRLEALITKSEIIEGLIKIFQNKKNNIRPADQISAAKQISSMMGFDEPTKTDLSISGDIKATVIKLFEDQEPLHE
jgi:chromosome segregation ATPase